MRELLIIGAGIAGVNAALVALKRPSVHVTLIDPRTYQTLPFTLARGAAGQTAFSQMSLPQLSGSKRLALVRSQAVAISLSERQVTTGQGVHRGDGLVIAVGRPPLLPPTAPADGPVVISPYHAAGAAELRVNWQRALATRAQRTTAPAPVNIAVVGGGAFGVELALTIANAAPFACSRYGAPDDTVHVALFEAAERVLPDWPARAAATAGRELHLAGVEINSGWRIDRLIAGGLAAGDEEWPADIVVWATGRGPHPLLAASGLPLSPDGSLITDKYLRLGDGGWNYAAGECVRLDCGWDWARHSGRIAALNALSRTRKLAAPASQRRRYLNLSPGRSLALADKRLALAWPLAQRARMLSQRLATGGWDLFLQAWPAPTPDHSLAAWRDAADRRRPRHAERDPQDIDPRERPPHGLNRR
jgi:NADH dehydrogenase